MIATTAAPTRPQLTAEQIASARLLDFCKFMFARYEIAAHHRIIAEALERVERGETKRLMIFLPPRHGKSFLASTHFPAWFLGRNPSRHVIAATYAQELADDFGRSVRNIMADDHFTRVFPRVKLQKDSKSAKRFHTRDHGVYCASGAGGPITGRGAHLLLIDDPIKNREEAESPTVRRKLRDWYSSTAYPRLMPGGAVVVIQTRWHEDDLAGWLLREHAHEGWEVINLPAVAEVDETWQLRGGPWHRAAGEALWPAWFPRQALELIKTSIGTRDWSALYQQRPVPAQGGLVQLPWFNRYVELPRIKRIVLSLDTASKDNELNDPSCATTWAETVDGDHYLLDVWLDRVQYPDLRRALVNLAMLGELRPHAILVEDKSSGTSLLQENWAQVLRDMGLQGTMPPLIAIEPDASKLVRFSRITPLIEAGHVYLPQAAAWLIDYESEITSFPLAPHDDQVDSTSQYVNWARDDAATALPRLDGAAGQRLRDSLRRLGGGQARVRL